MTALNAYNAVAPQYDARQQEMMAFRLMARRLNEATDRRSRNAALGINHELWSLMFLDLSSSNNRLPPILKQDCLTLARWSLAYSTRAVLSDLPLEPLIEINEQMAEGLGAKPSTSGAETDGNRNHARPDTTYQFAGGRQA